LTPKHVDVPELRRVLDFRPAPAPYLAAQEVEEGVQAFRPPVPDFELTVVSRAAAERGVEVRLGGPAIVVCTDGAVAIEGGPTVGRGQAVFVADEQWLGIRGDGVVFIASTGE
jgi:mannose-6-phosphate isomerase